MALSTVALNISTSVYAAPSGAGGPLGMVAEVILGGVVDITYDQLWGEAARKKAAEEARQNRSRLAGTIVAVAIPSVAVWRYGGLMPGLSAVGSMIGLIPGLSAIGSIAGKIPGLSTVGSIVGRIPGLSTISSIIIIYTSTYYFVYWLG